MYTTKSNTERISMLRIVVILVSLIYVQEIFSCYTIKKVDRATLTESKGYSIRNIDTINLFLTLQHHYELKLSPNEEIYLPDIFFNEQKINRLSLYVQTKFTKMHPKITESCNELPNKGNPTSIFQISEISLNKIKLYTLYITFLRKPGNFKGYSIRNINTLDLFITLRDEENKKIVKKLQINPQEEIFVSNKFFDEKNINFLILKLLIAHKDQPSHEHHNKVKDLFVIMESNIDQSNPLEIKKVFSVKKFPLFTTILETPEPLSDNRKIYNIVSGLNCFETTDGEIIKTKFEEEKDLTHFFKNTLLYTERTNKPYMIMPHQTEEINLLPELDFELVRPHKAKEEEISKPSSTKDEPEQSPKLQHTHSDPDQYEEL
jgi:hypothetical protein